MADASGSGSPAGGKRTAGDAFAGDEATLGSLTTLDDVMASPVGKKAKLLDEELPDVDDNEEFPQPGEDLEDAEVDTEGDGAQLDVKDGSEDDLDLEDLAPPATDEEDKPNGLNQEEEDDDEQEEDDDDEEDPESSAPPSQEGDRIDIVDVDEDEDETEDDGEGGSTANSRASSALAGGQVQDEDEDDDYDEDTQDEEEMGRALRATANKREARQLLAQLDDSARSKLCLTALEKYGEELFFGHEDARDAILIDACAQDSILSLVREANRVRELYARGTSAAPVELDEDDEDDEDDGEEEEDEEEEEEDDASTAGPSITGKTGASGAIVLISEDDDDDDEEDDDDEDPSSSRNVSQDDSAPDGGNDEEEDDEEEDDEGAVGSVGGDNSPAADAGGDE